MPKSEAEIVKTMYLGQEDELVRIKDEKLRKPLTDYLKRHVRDAIETARSESAPIEDRLSSAFLLLRSLRCRPDEWDNGFALWFARIGKLLGTADCYEVGTKICDRKGFTIQEAERLVNELDPIVKQQREQRREKSGSDSRH